MNRFNPGCLSPRRPVNDSNRTTSALALAALVATALSGAAWAQQESDHEVDRVHGQDHDHTVPEEIVITATPLARDIIEMSQSATVLSGTALEREVANNIGDTLSRIPGIANASFGQNLGRPVIRGLQGARVGVLHNNMNSGGVSAVSQDHAVPIEPFLADQIEVLRGPATLLYGSGSIGGVVNIVTYSIPQDIPVTGFEGRAMVQGDSAAGQRFAAGRVDFAASSFAFHADAFYRRTDDYEIPGRAKIYPDTDEFGELDEEEGVLENSFLNNEGGALGGSWIGNRWRFGLSFTGYDSDYGIPGAQGLNGKEQSGEEEPVTVGLKSRRLDGELVGANPFSGFEQLKLKLASSGYEHVEFEGDEVGTVFENDTKDVRLELRHNPRRGWQGAFGLQYTSQNFSAVGEEAFVVPSATQNRSIFWVESVDFTGWKLDLGLRYENVGVKAKGLVAFPPEAGIVLPRGSFRPLSASFGVVWHLSDAHHLSFNLSRAERAPTDQELFAYGPHIATQTFEVGNPLLDTETNLHMEGSYRIHQGRLTGSLTFYRDSFKDYIYLRNTGQVEDGFPLRIWSQRDADFIGGELELRYDIGRYDSGHWQVFGLADVVRAELTDGSNVPQLPPSRMGLGMDWDFKRWAANLSWIRASSHNDVAQYETPTPGYDLLNAELSYLLAFDERSEWELFLKGHNLLDEDIRNSTSYLKDQAPQIGRNFIFGLKTRF